MSNVIDMAAGRRADAAEMARFLAAMHLHAAPADDFQVCIGVYPNGGEQYWARSRFAPVGAGVENIARGFARFATEAANAGTGDAGQTVAIRVCGLGPMRKEKRPDEPYEGDANVVFASFIAIEVDARPSASLRALRGVFGEPTMLVESGGVWTGPDGVAERKVHIYYRLDRPARTDEDLALLKTVRSRACRLVDADSSGVSLGHPMRLPGTWHTKGEPKLCRIVGGDPEREISLDVALRNVTEALEAEGLAIGGAAAIARGERKGFKTQIEWHASDLRTAAAIMPNDGVAWEDWNTRGMAFWDASHAGADGLEAFIEWSRKDTQGRFDEGYCEARWAHWHVSPPAFASGDTLARHVRKEEPSWSPSATLMEHWYEPIDEPTPAALARAAGVKAPTKGGGIFDEDDADGEGAEAEPEQPSNVTPLFGDRADDAAPLWVREMNKRHAIVEHKGNTFAITENDDNSVSKSSPTALRTRYAPWPVQSGRSKTNRYDAWEAHAGRRFYEGWTFDPGGRVPRGFYNRWRGFPPLEGEDRVDASGAGCALILAHMRDIVCCGNEEHFAYLVRWLAHLIQKPGEKPGVAVILQGLEGTGKDTLGYYVERLMPPFYVNTSQEKHITGSFNSHLATCLLFHVEELGWIGKTKDKDGVLKSLITNPNHIEEGKGVDVDTGQRSFLRLLITSNEKKVVPASAEARRYFALRVSDARRKDEAYFAAIERERSGQGPAALRKYLAAIDLTAFSVRNCPETDALADLKSETLEGFDLYWSEVVEDGDAFSGDAGEPWEENSVFVEKEVFYQRYARWCPSRKDAESKKAVSLKLARALGSDVKTITVQARIGEGEKRAWCYKLPSLSAIRAKL